MSQDPLPSSADLAADLQLALHADHPQAEALTVGTRILVRIPGRPSVTLTRVEAHGVLRWLKATQATAKQVTP